MEGELHDRRELEARVVYRVRAVINMGMNDVKIVEQSLERHADELEASFSARVSSPWN